MDKQFSRIRAYILVKGVATMVVKINGKPIQVKEEKEKKFDIVLFGMTVVGYGFIFWLILTVFKLFVGVI
jgi:hypothetical protein